MRQPLFLGLALLCASASHAANPSAEDGGRVVEKDLPSSAKEKRRWIDPQDPGLSLVGQCELVGLPRSTWYYEPVGETADNLALMRQIDELYLR